MIETVIQIGTTTWIAILLERGDNIRQIATENGLDADVLLKELGYDKPRVKGSCYYNARTLFFTLTGTRATIRENIAHECGHALASLTGVDPMDEQFAEAFASAYIAFKHDAVLFTKTLADCSVPMSWMQSLGDAFRAVDDVIALIEGEGIELESNWDTKQIHRFYDSGVYFPFRDKMLASNAMTMPGVANNCPCANQGCEPLNVQRSNQDNVAGDVKHERREVSTGPKGCVAYFVRPSDNRQILVYPRKGEGRDSAIQRVTSRHGVKLEDVTFIKS